MGILPNPGRRHPASGRNHTDAIAAIDTDAWATRITSEPTTARDSVSFTEHDRHPPRMTGRAQVLIADRHFLSTD